MTARQRYQDRIRRRGGDSSTTKVGGHSKDGNSTNAQRSMSEVAAILGCSRQAVHQVERTALYKLRVALLPTLRELNPELAAQYESK